MSSTSLTVSLQITSDMTCICSSDATFLNDDALHRGLLSLPQEPAVMRVSVFSIIFQEMTRGYTSTLAMSHWHDIPVVGCVSRPWRRCVPTR